MRSHARVVIVGGGMMGAGLLYHLAEEGWKDIVLIEKGELTSGSTWHAAGQCPSFIADYNMAKIHHYGNTLYPKLEEMTGQYVSWHGCGGIRFAMTDAEVEFFKHVEGVSKLIGYRMQLVGPNEIKQINPHVDVTGVKLGAWTLDDGHVDPAGCCNALAKGARDMGAEIIRRCRVTDIKPTATGEWEVITEQGNIICEHVVNAAGCYARQVAQWVGADVPICNMKHHYIVTEPIKEFVEADVEMPVMRDPYPDAYYRQEQKAGLIGIYETEGAEEAWADRGGFPEWESENELFSEELDRISPWIEKTLERMPIWAESGIKRIVHGAIPHTPDSNPLLGPAGGLKNYWMCNGSSIGIAQGAGCGKYLAQWMVHGEAEINMAGLDPRRYGKWATEDHVKSRSIEDYQHMYVLHVPGEERPAGRGQRKTSLHDVLAERGGLFSPTAGWERVKYYSKDGSEESPSYSRTNAFEVVAEECKGVMENAGLGEFSSFAKFEVTGPDSEKFLNRVLANKVPKKQGGIGLAHFLNDHGVIEGEVTITKLADNHYYLLSGALAEVRDEDWLNQHTDNDDVKIVNVTEYYGNLVLAGPKSREILASITDADVSNEAFRWLSAQTITVGGCEVRAARVNYIGELGWELHVRMEEMPKLFAALEEAGKPHGMVLFGIYAQNSMRMEKAYRGWGSELTNEITMIEADMERFVRFDKADDFIGKAATQQRKQDGITQKLVYCEVDVDGSDVMGGEACVVNGEPVGIATSGGYGHRCGKSLAFAYVQPDLAEPGSTFDILMLGEARKATVLAEPAFDAANERLRG